MTQLGDQPGDSTALMLTYSLLPWEVTFESQQEPDFWWSWWAEVLPPPPEHWPQIVPPRGRLMEQPAGSVLPTCGKHLDLAGSRAGRGPGPSSHR